MRRRGVEACREDRRDLSERLNPASGGQATHDLSLTAHRSAAVGRIYAEEGRRLRVVAERIVRSRERAEDVIHDAFVQILRDASQFDPARGSVRAWVYSIVRNTALKSAYRARREVPVADDNLISLCDHTNDTTSRDGGLADRVSLAACLQQLAPKRRASIILSIIDGRTHAEIADCLGVPVGTVKAWIRRELIALRERLNCD